MGGLRDVLSSLLLLSITISTRLCNALSSLTMSSSSRPRTFLVTGATDGIGRHTSQRLASDGHALLIHGRKAPSDGVVSSLVRDLESRGAARVAYLQADLCDLEQAEGLAEQVNEELRSWQSPSSSSSGEEVAPLDVLINNAGVFDPEPRYSAQGYDATMAINVLAPFVLTRRLLPNLVRGSDARIITTSSISQSGTLPDLNSLFARKLPNGEHDHKPLTYSAHSSYSHSKLGDLLITQRLAKALSGHRIQCLTMDPGTVNTKMLLAGWGPCGISVRDANNTYKLATGEEYAFGEAENGSYHFGWGGRRRDDRELEQFWSKLAECTGVDYDDLSDCL